MQSLALLVDQAYFESVISALSGDADWFLFVVVLGKEYIHYLDVTFRTCNSWHLSTLEAAAIGYHDSEKDDVFGTKIPKTLI